MTEDIDITVRTKLYRTESREKIEEAVRNLFPNAEFEEGRAGENGGGDDEHGDERDEDTELVAHAGGDKIGRAHV